MANQIVDLPVPVGNGVGAAVSVAGLSADKTVTVRGDFVAIVEVQARAVAAADFLTIATFSGPRKFKLSLAAEEMRVRVRAHSQGQANVDVGAEGGALQSVQPTVPANTGAGPSSSIANFPQFMSIFCTGSFEGLCVVQISLDGINWSRCAQFQSEGGFANVEVTGSLVRVARLGSAAGTPIVAVAATTGPAGGGAAAAGNALIFDPTGSRPTAANVFTDFAELHSAANAIQGPKLVVFDSGGSGTLTIPVGAYDFSEWIIQGVPFFFGTGVGTTIVFTEGTTVSYTGQLTIGENARIEFTGTTPVITPAAGDILFVQNGASVLCTGTGPFISLSGLAATEIYLIFLFRGGRFEDGLAGQAVIDIPVAGSILFANVLDGGELRDDTISGIGGSVLSLSVASGSAQFSPTQPSFAGLLFFNNPQKGRWLPRPPAGGAKPVTDIIMGETHVYDTSGGAVAQPLPSVSGISPGDSVIFKKVAGGATLTLTPDGADTIDGGPSFVVAAATGSIMLIRDQLPSANWLVFGAGP